MGVVNDVFERRRGGRGEEGEGEEERGQREGGATCGGTRVLGRVSLSTGTACRRIGDCPPIRPNAQAPTPNSNLGTGVYTDWLFCRYGLSTEAHCRDHLLSGRCARSSFAASGCSLRTRLPSVVVFPACTLRISARTGLVLENRNRSVHPKSRENGRMGERRKRSVGEGA